MSAPKLAKPLAESDLTSVLGVISAAKVKGQPSQRGTTSWSAGRICWAAVCPSCAGCGGRTSNRWMRAATFASSAREQAPNHPRQHRHAEAVRVVGPRRAWGLAFPSNKRNGPLTRQAVAARMAMWGREANVRLHPHRCRHTHATHAIRRGVDVFTLSATLGHSSTGTTSHYVLAEPGESSSLKLG